MVDLDLEESPLPKVARIEVGRSRRPSCRKIPADDSVVTERSAEHLFHITIDVWRSTILYKLWGCITSPYLKSRKKGLL
ncbi:hypothetical protein TNCV_1605931 [Trichonephila clavipes]|nr:hypothetical protein TNCV_1605931 [Trichonephila clavipes]